MQNKEFLNTKKKSLVLGILNVEDSLIFLVNMIIKKGV